MKYFQQMCYNQLLQQYFFLQHLVIDKLPYPPKSQVHTWPAGNEFWGKALDWSEIRLDLRSKPRRTSARR